MEIALIVFLCLFVYLVGFIMGARFYAKRTKHDEHFIERVVEEVVKGPAPEGDFITVNKVDEYIRDHEGEIKLGDILEE